MSGSDKYGAVWVSHSSISDFLACPRAYYLHNVYRNKEGRKITIVNAALSLGQVVHTVLEDLRHIPFEERLQRDLLADYEAMWQTVAGKRGGFVNVDEEIAAKARGRAMIERVQTHRGPLAHKTVKLRSSHNGMPPNMFLDAEETLILCGLVDWLEYVEEDDSVRIIDFKTGKHEEKKDSLQLPIYALLVDALQPRRASGAAYWYLEYDDAPRDVSLPDLVEAHTRVIAVAQDIKAARERNEFHCPYGALGCFSCRPYEQIIAGKAEYVGIVGYGVDAYSVS